MNRLHYIYRYSISITKSLTIQKLVNLVLLRVSFFLSWALKIHVIWGKPAFLSIEPTNMCNLQCPECPTGNKTSEVAKGKISVETYINIISAVKKQLIFLNLYFQGEPFLHEKMPQLISIAQKAGITVSTSTNAHFIDSSNVDAIILSGLHKIIISLDGYDQKSYEIYRKKGSFDTVISALGLLQTAKKRHKSKTPLIEVQCLLFKHTENYMQEIKQIGKQHGADIVVFKTAQFYSPENIAMLPAKKHSRYIHNKDANTLTYKRKLKNKCWRMWSSVVCAWNGDVVPCCFDKNHTYTYGNSNTEDFNDILQSKKTRAFKTLVHSNRKRIPMCTNCSS